MPDRVVDSSPSEDELSERERTPNVRIMIGVDSITALNALIQEYDVIAHADGAAQPIPPRHVLVEEAIRSQIRRHRGLRRRGLPVPLPEKNAGAYRLGWVPRRLHDALLKEQQQLNTEFPDNFIALRDITEEGIRRILLKYRRKLAVLRKTMVVPPDTQEPHKAFHNISIGKTALEALDALIGDLEEAAQTDDLAPHVPSRKELVLDAIRSQIRLHRRLRRHGQKTPIPLSAAGPYQQVAVSWQVRAALREEQERLHDEHIDELEHTISLRELAEAGIRTLIADYRQRLGESVEPAPEHE